MSREIKFRLWIGENKTMIPENTVSAVEDYRNAVFNPRHDVMPLQYTSLKDKNGKEIYEGDIMRCLHFIEGISTHYLYHKIKWDNEFGCWAAINIDNCGKNESLNTSGNLQLWSYIRGSKEIFIIGNAFENPELLIPSTTTP